MTVQMPARCAPHDLCWRSSPLRLLGLGRGDCLGRAESGIARCGDRIFDDNRLRSEPLGADWRWALFAFAFPAACMGLAAAAHVALGGTLPQSPPVGHLWLAAANVLLIFMVGGPLGEEFGWRGFALPALQAHWGWRVSSVLLGVVWAAWHLSLFDRAGTLQSHLPIGLYALSLLASSVLFAWLFNRSNGSVVPVLALHTAIDA